MGQTYGGSTGRTTRVRWLTFWDAAWDWIKTIVLCTVIALGVRGFVLESFNIDGTCMEPTVCTGERVFVFKLAYRFVEPRRGDIIVFRYPLNPKKDYIKRVIALPGETVSMVHGVVYLNGQELDESAWAVTPDRNRYPDTPAQVVPPGQLFVLGDNRPESEDSRVWGFVPYANVKGQAVLRYWPLGLLRWLG